MAAVEHAGTEFWIDALEKALSQHGRPEIFNTDQRCYGASGQDKPSSSLETSDGCPMPQPNDLSRSLAALDQDNTLIAVIEIRQLSWLVAGIGPGVDRQPLKKLAADETALLQLLYRWRDEATKAGRAIDRNAVAYEAGRDGFWLARWLRSVSRQCETRTKPGSDAPSIC